MAVGADFHADRLAGRTGGIGSSTGARDRDLFVFRMNAWFHCLFLYLKLLLSETNSGSGTGRSPKLNNISIESRFAREDAL